MELILPWDVCEDTILAEMKDIQMLQVSSRVGHAPFPGWPTVTVCDNVNGKAGRTRRLKTRIIRSHGIKKKQIMSLG